MYKFFCRNLSNFLKSNEENGGIRYEYAKELIPLLDINKYMIAKENESDYYFKTNYMISQLEEYSRTNTKLNDFVWELWAYGFDTDNTYTNIEKDNIEIDEMVKILKLLLTTHYM